MSSQSVLSAESRALCLRVFRKLGVEKTAMGLKGARDTWNRCFFALALGDGKPGVIEDMPEGAAAASARLSGLAPSTVSAFIGRFDSRTGAVKALGKAWLKHTRTLKRRTKAARAAK